MARKTHDIVAKVGEYTDRSGQTKARYENVGALMEGDNGPFIMTKRTFNIAGLPNDGRDNALLSCFVPRDSSQQGGGQSDSGQRSGAPAGGAGSDFSDEIPFAPEWRL